MLMIWHKTAKVFSANFAFISPGRDIVAAPRYAAMADKDATIPIAISWLADLRRRILFCISCCAI